MKRGSRLLILLCIISMFVLNTPVNTQAAAKIGKVNYRTIKMTKTSKDYVYCTFKWKAVKGAKSYQVQIIDNEWYEYYDTILVCMNKTTSTNKICLKCPSRLSGLDMYRIRVRAVGKKTKGKWVVSAKKFGTYIY